MDEQGFSGQVNRRVARATLKAWRFEGEMKEIASKFHEAGVPDGFHIGAAEIYQRMAKFKDSDEIPSLADVFEALLAQ
jgi:hypothetical protein